MCVTSLCTRGALDAWSRGRSTAALCGTFEVCVTRSPPPADPPMSEDETVRVARLSERDVQNIDAALLAEASAQWRKIARLVGGAMSNQPTRVLGIPDTYYAQRVRSLVERGLLESDGDLNYMGRSEVRLSPKRRET